MEIKALKNGYQNLVIQNAWLGAKACTELRDAITDKASCKELVKNLTVIIEQEQPVKAKTNKTASADADLIAQIVAQVLKASK